MDQRLCIVANNGATGRFNWDKQCGCPLASPHCCPEYASIMECVPAVWIPKEQKAIPLSAFKEGK